ncbi:MAG: hypothetical protein ACR2KH_06890 [Sphingomicrobium sp.]
MTNRVILERRRGDPGIAAEGDVPGAALVHCQAVQTGGVAEELTRISRLLGTLGETLAADPRVVFIHGTQLYNLGLAARTLAALAETLPAE